MYFSGSRTFLITGINGQDGTMLSLELLNRYPNCKIVGTFQRGSRTWRLNEASLTDKVVLVENDLSSQLPFLELLDTYKPDSIFHLAASSYTADSFDSPSKVFSNNLSITINLLEVLRYSKLKPWCFIASSAEAYGGNSDLTVNETSALSPLNPYGISKASIQYLIRLYRNAYNLRLCCGILFNHEGEYRDLAFVTRKITSKLVEYSITGKTVFSLGNIDSLRDWSYAGDFVKAFIMLEDGKLSDDFVFASGKLHSVRNFIESVCQILDIRFYYSGEGLSEKCFDARNNQLIFSISPKYYRPIDTPGHIGDSTKLRNATGWNPSTTFRELCAKMVENDIKRLNDKI